MVLRFLCLRSKFDDGVGVVFGDVRVVWFCVLCVVDVVFVVIGFGGECFDGSG